MAAEEKKGILLETGTNEFEIVEFSIGNVNYGINVAKVREVITRTPVTEMPQAHPYIDGLFTLRGNAIPLVNLPRCLNVPTKEEPKNIIVTEINNYNIGFLVDNVSRIHRISWKNMEPAPEVGDQSRVVGIVKMQDAETGGETFIDTSSSAVRRAHHEWWVTHQSWLKDVFTKSNIDNISVRTDEDYVKALMNLFRRRS